MSTRPILSETRNCWKIAPARRAALIVDAEGYFRAVRESISLARESIFIMGWDLHSELRLVRNGSDDGLPDTLCALLDAVAAERPNLDIHILNWDFAMIYAMEREFFPRYRLQWKSHDRVHFCLDGEHPVGGSQHQKIVVVDDSVAFVGGIDLGKWRWDTSAHEVDDPRRTDPDGKAYPPFHDMQMVVDGGVAAAIGELGRKRWSAATGSESATIGQSESDPWPPSIESDFEDVSVAIARTMPAYDGREEVREVERLYLDSIAAAKDFIYIENQYFSSHEVGCALARRLKEPNGPEIVIVGPEKTGGWLEQHTMDVLRARLVGDLYEADAHNRLRVYYARLSEDPHVALMIHAKAMIVDDRYLRVGSSNLSNRSMGLDSECDVALESTEARDIRGLIAGVRRRLLAEHLGVVPEAVEKAEEECSSLIAAIESLRTGERTLEPLSVELPGEVDRFVPDQAWLDPEQPIEPDALLEYFTGKVSPKKLSGNLLKVGVLVAAVVALIVAWRWTPLGNWLNVDTIVVGGERLRALPFTPLLVLGAYIVAGFAIIPVTLLYVATVIVFGPWLGLAYALAGAELSALACFGAGRLLGRDAVSRLAGSRLNRISRKLSERGIVTMITLRVIPIAPFSVVNIVAGVSEIRPRDFALGNMLGMLPGIIAIAFVTDRALASLRSPSATTIVSAIAVVLMAAAGLAAVRHWLRSRGQKS